MSATERGTEFAARPVLLVAAVVGLVQLVAAGIGGGYWFDEAYMLAIGRDHLDLGSADQPPITPALAAAVDWLAPGNILILRLPAILATAGAVVLAALIARELGGDRRAQLVTALAQATTLWITMAGHWLTPYTLEPVQWLLILWLLVRWLRLRDDRLLLALGVAAGLAVQTKFQVVLLGAVLAASLLACGPRELLRRPLLWAGAGIALLLALPTLWWQARNGWPQLRMGEIVASEADALYGGRPGVAIALIVMAGIAGTALALYGTWRLLRTPELRFLGVTAVVLYVFFVVTVGRPYYLNGLYGVLFAAGALGLQQRRLAGSRFGWVVWPGFALSAAAAAGMLAFSVVSAKPDVPQHIAREAVGAYDELPAAERERTAVFGESYIVAAYIDLYAPRLTPAYSTNRSYGYFDPPPDSARDVLYVGKAPDELRPHFADCRELRPVQEEMAVWHCTGRGEPWPQLWPRLRHLNVG
ncbi:ArnT family glycosyltransferase [Nocardia asteroides]|uniref:ArnT family glycosyltransferase n=1 Tax=Nocardia asteroides TaxID=1824 RepID=UPI001E49B8EA|nr:glycosyltransferase family 39 protein [Nocardia asteroides]UGT63927.1 glycosyltransferase family 39 protein [Nocardia asteroides]